MVTVSDRKIQVQSTTLTITTAYYEADIVSANDYYPFGMAMPGRSFSSDKYRYGFNGKEKDNSTGEGNLDFGARILDVRLGRWLSVDAYSKYYPNYSTYCFSLSNPVVFKDGNENWVLDKDGNPVYTVGKIYVSPSKDGKSLLFAEERYYFTNDGQKVFALYYFGQTLKVNTDEDVKTKAITVKKGITLDAIPVDDTYDCHSFTCFSGPPYIPGIDMNKKANAVKIFKNTEEFTPILESEIVVGDVALFVNENGDIQHSALVDGTGTLTTKNDRDPLRFKNTVADIEADDNGSYGKLEGYYRPKGDVGLSLTTKNSGEISETDVPKIQAALKIYKETVKKAKEAEAQKAKDVKQNEKPVEQNKPKGG